MSEDTVLILNKQFRPLLLSFLAVHSLDTVEIGKIISNKMFIMYFQCLY